jgi:hypothetical protein
MIRLVLSLVLLLAVSFPARPGRADEPSSLELLYQAANVDLAEGRSQAALEKFRRGLELVEADSQQAWPMLLGQAMAYEKMGQLDHAVDAYRRFLSAYSKNPVSSRDPWARRAKLVEDQVVATEASLLGTRGALVVSSQPQGARIEVDGRAVGSEGGALTPFTVYLGPGPHEVRLSRDGYRTTTSRTEIQVGTRITLDVPLEAQKPKGRLTVVTGSADALVSVDRSRVGEGAEVTVEIDAGTHAVRVACPGRPAFEQTVTVTPAAPVVVTVTSAPVAGPVPVMQIPVERAVAVAPAQGATPVVEAAPALAAAEPTVSAPAVRRAARPLWGWLGVGVGGAVLATGAVFTVLAKLKHDDLVSLDGKLDAEPALLADPATYARYDDLRGAVQQNQIIAGVMYGVGGAAVVGSAVYLIFFADHGRKVAGLPLQVVPRPEGGVTAVFTW